MKLSIALAAGAVTLLAAASWAQTPTATATPSCDQLRCLVQGQINACATPVPGRKFNHGRYVSCVAHVVKQLAQNGTIPPSCKGKITRCAARSTFGKSAFETCQLPVYGKCVGGLCPDGTTMCTSDTDCGQLLGACNNGLCPDGVTMCTSSTDCAVTRCRIVRAFPPDATPVPGGDRCTLLGGTAGAGSCCASCPP
jgi:hypothetical protein